MGTDSEFRGVEQQGTAFYKEATPKGAVHTTRYQIRYQAGRLTRAPFTFPHE